MPPRAASGRARARRSPGGLGALFGAVLVELAALALLLATATALGDEGWASRGLLAVASLTGQVIR